MEERPNGDCTKAAESTLPQGQHRETAGIVVVVVAAAAVVAGIAGIAAAVAAVAGSIAAVERPSGHHSCHSPGLAVHLQRFRIQQKAAAAVPADSTAAVGIVAAVVEDIRYCREEARDIRFRQHSASGGQRGRVGAVAQYEQGRRRWLPWLSVVVAGEEEKRRV